MAHRSNENSTPSRRTFPAYRRRAAKSWVALSCLVLASSASGVELKCPEQIRTEQKIGVTTANWTATPGAGSGAINNLAAIQFFDGPPSDMASLAPDQTLELVQKSVAIWKFAPRTASGIWIACDYFLTTVILTRKLPAGIRQCKATYRKGYADVESIICR